MDVDAHGSSMPAGSGRVRTAVFVDFDNVFGGLVELDEEAAMSFAREPGAWLRRLGRLGSAQRDPLIRRCYLNPRGSVHSERYGNDRQRLFYANFRAFFTRDGFEVVDCPPLTARDKNAADIRIALDVVDALQHPTRFDEFIVLSGDSDFTPVLRRVREFDRRTVAVSSTIAARAYEATVDLFLGGQDLVGLLRPEGGDDLVESAVVDGAVAGAPDDDGASPSDDEIAAGYERAVEVAESCVRESDAAVLLTTISARIRSELNDLVEASSWFGRGTLSGVLADARLRPFERSARHLRDPRRHELPPDRATVTLPEPVERVASVTTLPRLSAEAYRATFDELCAWAQDEPYNLTTITKEVRDRLRHLGHDVGRRSLGVIVHGCAFGGAPLNGDPSPDAGAAAQAFARSVEASAESAHLELDADELATVRAWIAP